MNGYFSEILGYEATELVGFTLSDIADMIRKVQDGLAGTEPHLTEEEIMDEAQKIYEVANS
jgi:hypothetical protein